MSRIRATLVKVGESAADEYGDRCEQDVREIRDMIIFHKTSGGENLSSGFGSAEFLIDKSGLDGLNSRWKIEHGGASYNIEHFYPEPPRKIRIMARVLL